MKIRKRSNSWTVDTMIEGKRHRKDFKTYNEAQDYLHSNKKYSYKSLSLKDAIRDTYEYVWNNTPNGDNAYRNAELISYIIGKDTCVKNIDTKTIDHVVKCLRLRNNSNNTINNKISSLMVVLKRCKDRGYIDRLPVFKRFKTSQGRLRFFTKEEEVNILNAHKKLNDLDFANFIMFLIDTGLRTGEAVKLRWRDIQKQNDNTLLHVWETKNGEFRTVPLSSRCVDLLSSRGEGLPDQVIFPYTKSTIRTKWNRVRNVLGYADDAEFVPHVCRHTCASRLVQNGVPIKVVQEWMGHKSIQVTLRYAKLQPNQLIDALAVMENL